MKLSANERVKLEKTLWIEADQTLPYGVVVTAMAQARAAGVSKLMMLTSPTEQADLGKLDEQAGSPAPTKAEP